MGRDVMVEAQAEAVAGVRAVAGVQEAMVEMRQSVVGNLVGPVVP